MALPQFIQIYICFLPKFYYYKSCGNVFPSIWKNIFEWEIPRSRMQGQGLWSLKCIIELPSKKVVSICISTMNGWEYCLPTISLTYFQSSGEYIALIYIYLIIKRIFFQVYRPFVFLLWIAYLKFDSFKVRCFYCLFVGTFDILGVFILFQLYIL